MCNLEKKSHKDTVGGNAACKHIRMMAKQYQIASLFAR